MKKIVIIPSPSLPVPATKGGAVETLIQNLLEENEIQKKFSFFVFSTFDKEASLLSKKFLYTKFYFFKWNIFLSEITIIFSRIFNKIFNFFPCPSIDAFCIFLNIKKINPELIFIEGGDLEHPYYQFLSRKFGKKKMIAHIHGVMKSTPKIDKNYSHIISTSNYVKEIWNKSSTINGNNNFVLLNGINIDKFDRKIKRKEKINLKKKLNIGRNDFIVLFCGRIDQSKGIKELIYAMENFYYKNVKLLIVGSSNFGKKSISIFQEEVLELVHKKKGKIVFTGFVHNDDLYKYYQLANVIVAPSLIEEAALLVGIEAMASGKPIISTNAGGNVEYISKKCGIIVEKDQFLIQNLRESIKKIYEEKTLQKKYSINGKINAQKFSSKEYYNNFFKIIKQILSKNNYS
jgi:spore coat protein SA